MREVTTRRRDEASPSRLETEAARGEPLPRAQRRRDEQAHEDSLDSENRRHEREMQELERRLEEAEQGDNARKIKAVNWMIARENSRHEKEAERLSREAAPSRSRTAGRAAAASTKADRDEGDRYGRDRGSEAGLDNEAWGPDREPRKRTRLSRQQRDEEEVSNPIRERYRRERGLDQDRERETRSSRRYDRDDENEGRPTRADRTERKRKPNTIAERVAEADGPMRRY